MQYKGILLILILQNIDWIAGNNYWLYTNNSLKLAQNITNNTEY